MKKLMKRLLAVVAAMTMVLGMSISAFAATGNFTITIDNAVDGETYKAYKIFDAEYNTATPNTTTVAYTATKTIVDLINRLDNSEKAGITFTKIGTSDNYTVTVDKALFNAANFAKGIDGIKGSLTQAGQSVVAANGTATISVTETGYYFVDTSTGSLCSLDTAKDVTIYEKNSVPSVTDKQVKNDNKPNSQFDISADGSVGDKFSFKITATTGSNNKAPDNTTGRDKVFTITDKLGAGFTLDKVTGFTVTNTTTTPSTVLSATGENPDYSVTTVAGTGDDAGKTIITITLNASALAKQNETITVDYKATLNENAIDNNAVATNNANGKETKTYTYDFALDKVDKANHETKLSGVKFTLTNSDGKYYVAPSDTENVNEAVFGYAENKLTTNDLGHIDFKGLAAGTYTLTETDTVAGYNKLTSPIIITITAGENGSATVTAKMGDTDLTVGTGNLLTVENGTGSQLPSTGGMGTTIFYALGAALAIGAGVVLVTRKRLSK